MCLFVPFLARFPVIFPSRRANNLRSVKLCLRKLSVSELFYLLVSISGPSHSTEPTETDVDDARLEKKVWLSPPLLSYLCWLVLLSACLSERSESVSSRLVAFSAELMTDRCDARSTMIAMMIRAEYSHRVSDKMSLPPFSGEIRDSCFFLFYKDILWKFPDFLNE